MNLKHKAHTLVSRARNLRPVTGDIVVIDSVLPNKNPLGPRNSDLIEFTKNLPGFKYYTMYHMMPGKEAWFPHGYGQSKEQYTENLAEHTKLYPEVAESFELLSPDKRYRFNLAYTYFLAETYTLLPFLEKNKIPFVFLLNPGGAFGIDNPSSDSMLAKIFASPYFKKVIVNQELFKDYLLKKKLCPENDIVYDFSGSVQFKPTDVVRKKYFKKQKKTFDICFVAAKYSEKGVDKGYDLFVAAAKRLATYRPDIRFHVVGGFDDQEIDVTKIKDRITFHSYLKPETLPNFYARMDIFVSPNRAFQLYEGHCDGFPLPAGAMYCGVCGFATDPLRMNREFLSDEIVIIKPTAADIVKRVMYFYDHLDELYAISKKGQRKAQSFFDIEKHIAGRIQLFQEIKRGMT